METDANGRTFQETYIDQWQDYILGKGTDGFSMKDSINDSLKATELALAAQKSLLENRPICIGE